MKILPPRCTCPVCSRSLRSDPLPPPRSPLPRPSSDTCLGSRGESSKNSTFHPIASTSRVTYSLPLAVILPNEILLDIFELARPSVSSNDRNWYARLATAHSRWSEAARECLARVVVIKDIGQISKLDEAIRTGTIGGKVEELVLDLRTMESGKAGPDTSFFLDCKLRELCMTTNETLRSVQVQGFGIRFFATLALPSLPALTTFEYSPIYSVHPPTSDRLFRFLETTRPLKRLVVRPEPQQIVSLSDIPLKSLNPYFPILSETIFKMALSIGSTSTVDIDSRTADEKLLMYILSALDGLVEQEAAQPEHISLSNVFFSLKLFFALTLNSFRTLTSISFVSAVVVQGGSRSLGYRQLFVNLRCIFAKQLEEFFWEDPSALMSVSEQDYEAEDAFRDFLGRCEKLRKLTPISPQVFHPLPTASDPLSTTANLLAPSPRTELPSSTTPPKPARARFCLPPQLEELTIGSTGREVRDVDLIWWLKRVEHLVEGNVLSLEEVEMEFDEAEGERDVDYHSLQRLFAIPSPSQTLTSISPPATSSLDVNDRSSNFRTLSISIPVPSLSVLTSSVVGGYFTRISKGCFATPGKAAVHESEELSEEEGRSKKTVTITLCFASVVPLDVLDLTRDIRIDMFGMN